MHCVRATQNMFKLFLIFLFRDVLCVITKLHGSCVRKYAFSQIPSLFYGSVLLPHVRNRKRSVGYDLGRSAPCLDAFKVVELVSLEPSVHLQLMK